MANTFTVSGSDPSVIGVYPEEWATKLQERLDKPTNWKDVCDVIYSDSQFFNLPYMSTEFVIQTGTRGTAYGFSDFTLTNDQLRINTYKPVPVFIDRADLAQCTLVTQMELASRQGKIIDEQIESAFLADHTNWTNFGDTGGGALGLASTQITVTTSNIDDITSGIIREIIVANGKDLAEQYGIAIVWRPADFEKLEKFLQANGFNLADQTLKNGIMTQKGYYALGAYHYVSNSHTANHVFAGVRKIETIGILKSTYGQIVVTQDPNLQSGIGVISRVDYGINVKAGLSSLVFDVNVV
jgi:hypothetical protein